MHDPLTVAFQFRRFGITIWHRDPEKRGDDDSCDWWGRNRPLNAKEQALRESLFGLETLLDNRPHYPDSREHLAFQETKRALYQWQQRSSWRIPVRWHVWHWHLQVDVIQDLKRWLFSRCCTCGRRFPWGYVPGTTSWNGTGPRWFRAEQHVYHRECYPQPIENKPQVSR